MHAHSFSLSCFLASQQSTFSKQDSYVMMARAFDSTSKKLAIPLFALFEIGWIFFTAGFILFLKSKIGDIILDKNNPVFYPHYMILVGGQFVVLLGLLHAALPSGTPNSIFGVLSTILNIIYFVSVGYLITANLFIILFFKRGKYYLKDAQLEAVIGHEVEQQLMQTPNLMLAGSVILVVSWSLVQFVSFFYEHRPQPVHVHVPTRGVWYVIAECWKNYTIVTGDDHNSVRLVSIIATFLSVIGWSIFILGLFSTKLVLVMIYLIGGWSAVTVTPLMYLVSLFYAGCMGKASTVLGIIASLLNTFFIVGMGFSVTFTGVFLYEITPELAAFIEAVANPGATVIMSQLEELLPNA